MPAPDGPFLATARALAGDVGYDSEGEGSVDDLVEYKNALEDALFALSAALDAGLARLSAAFLEARVAAERDEEEWSERGLAGEAQDSEEAEASGMLLGRVDGLQSAIDALDLPMLMALGRTGDAN